MNIMEKELNTLTTRLNKINFSSKIDLILKTLKDNLKKKKLNFTYDSIMRDCKFVVKTLVDEDIITTNIGNRFIHKLNDKYFNSSNYLGNKDLDYKAIINDLIEFIERKL